MFGLISANLKKRIFPERSIRCSAVPRATRESTTPKSRTSPSLTCSATTSRRSGTDRKTARKRWAALIKQMYETDPLICPKCGEQMKIISFIERNQKEVIEKILRYCGLWEEESARAPRVEAMDD